eukprot:6977649-Karenia_brevis.AAC.1
MASPFEIVKLMVLAEKKKTHQNGDGQPQSISISMTDGSTIVLKNGRSASWNQIRDEVTLISK